MKRKKTGEPVDKQRQSNGRKAGGKFAPGNPHGFKPGQSGNPAGRPKSVTLSEAIRLELAKADPGNPDATRAEKIAEVLVTAATAGDIQAAKEIADRTEGRPRQAVDVDMNLRDWRALASRHGLKESDVIEHARRLIESAATPSGLRADRGEGGH